MESIKLPDEAKGKAQALLAQSQQAHMRFEMYLQGCMDSLCSKGDWNMDTNTWAFEQRPKEKKDG